MRSSRLALLLVWIVGLFCTAQAKQLAVIANSANPATNITTAELGKILNTGAQTWPDGTSIKVVMRDPASAEMQLVLRLFGMTADKAQTFVQSHRDIFVLATSDEAIIQFVSTTRGAIGIVDLYSISSSVKVLKIDGKLPVEQGYALRRNSQ